MTGTKMEMKYTRAQEQEENSSAHQERYDCRQAWKSATPWPIFVVLYSDRPESTFPL